MNDKPAQPTPLHVEESSLNAWPSLNAYLFDGWLARFANGYTKRANSVTPLYPGKLDLEAKIGRCEELYRRQNLPPIFRLPSFSEIGEMDGRLAERGYKKIDVTSVQTLDLSFCFAQSSPRAYILPGRSGMDSWLGSFHWLSGSNPHRADDETHRQMLNNIVGEKCFMVLMVEGAVVACGLAVADNGYAGIFDLIVAEEHRREGYGSELMDSLLDWAVNEHAFYAYLQVMVSNKPAINLYAKLKFTELYRYWYRTL
ncbi:MAG: GNAT family N-acetyltransferase [Chloroflexi bacterium]|nr:GNAT family N-acetyltransferase [Chloroflexota bacterium]